MFACVSGDQYWPLTSALAFFDVPARRIVARLTPSLLRRVNRPCRDPRTYPDLGAALVAEAPFRFGVADRLFLLPAGRWTLVLTSAAPVAVDIYWLEARARVDLGCAVVAVEWTPATEPVPGNAVFIDHRPGGIRPRPPAQVNPEDHRTIQLSDQGADRPHWQLDLVGPERPYEDRAAYTRRPISERLPHDLLGRYAAAAGVAVHDPDLLDGPVTVLTRTGGGRTGAAWNTVADLRSLAGYPATGIPDRLGRRRAR